MTETQGIVNPSPTPLHSSCERVMLAERVGRYLSQDPDQDE